ncbi:hypothetical protein Ocin01_02899 [Orchesella cincta]|uniref:Uncharacterized protein n=1 Tax=Orchesella cincta TaxID=48709 RepID=A0A1D2NEV8_ORCCI|nr:hypothetical protein Ocin01_02899 [Orchesella cincta]
MGCGCVGRWSSGLMLHGTLVDGARAALLIPLGFSVLRCQPVTRCSLVDTAFLLLATVTSLNLLTAALSDAPLLPPPDANLLAETTAMPDSPQCVLFATFMVWFAALTINLGPTFLSGALAAQAEVTPRTPSCPLVRGPARHAVLNALWAAVNLLCIGLAVNHLRKLKKDLGIYRIENIIPFYLNIMRLNST